MRRLFAVPFLLAAVVSATATAQIYSGRTSSGTVVLSNFASAETPSLVAGRMPPVPPVPPAPSRAAADLGTIVSDVAREVDMPVRLLHAVIAEESAYDARAVSPKGAQGLMQLMPATARRFGVGDPFDPRENVLGGARYLKWLLELFAGDVRLALAGYNAGENAVIRAGYRIPPYAETQRYVPRVMARL